MFSVLSNLRDANEEFSRQLEKLRAISPNYATESLETSFNWDELAADIKDVEGEWYLVAFRSIRRADADNKLLYEADAKAHNEAILHGGLLKYWIGELNQYRECLSFCIWTNRDISIKATQKHRHTDAKRLADTMYETYSLESFFELE
ncbi:9957_t:CDS:2 [Dentiscutata heterogama]|uniref:9957_t:CDS:1 n=1 Tax=Dentiscutata heterogama TaxID=1316150 RepID=A0ACA9L6L1_9GLOM|nr:9957_t:CDS:2 [Dentiscutata heterogama]